MPQEVISLLGLYLMRTGMFALALGLLCLGFLPVLPSVGWLLVLLLGAVASLFTRLWPLGCFVLGLCWACWRDAVATNGAAPAPDERG